MRMRILLALLVLTVSLAAHADIGSCYSPRPICISGYPVCICDISLNCFWACR